jgi:hypothetical protein
MHLPFRPAKAVPYLSSKYAQQQNTSNQKMPLEGNALLSTIPPI